MNATKLPSSNSSTSTPHLPMCTWEYIFGYAFCFCFLLASTAPS